MNKLFENNSVLKIISFVIAVILWVYIIIVIDAPTERTFREVSIETVNTEVLTDAGYSIDRLSSNVASVRIEGSRRVIANFNENNLAVKLDFYGINVSRISEDEPLTVNLSASTEFGDILSFTPSAVDVYVSKTNEKKIDVEVNKTGSLNEGYREGDVSLSTQQITLSGTSENLSNVSRAEVSVDLSSVSSENYEAEAISASSPITLYDQSNKPMTEKDVRWINMDYKEIDITCPIYKVKTVPVSVIYDSGVSGTYNVSPSQITIYGPYDAIDAIESLSTETIYSNSFNNRGEAEVNLIIPPDIKVDGSTTEVKVSANSN